MFSTEIFGIQRPQSPAFKVHDNNLEKMFKVFLLRPEQAEAESSQATKRYQNKTLVSANMRKHIEATSLYAAAFFFL